MDESLMPLFIALFVVIVVAIAIGSHLQAKRRRDALQALAKRLGMTFSAAKRPDIAKQYAFLDALRKGSNRYAYNLIEGEYRNRRVRYFDFHYATRSTDSKGRRQTHHHYCSIALLHLERSFPELRIYPETFWSRLGQMIGFKDIAFESVEFSKAFVVRSKDRKFAYDICHPRMMEYLLNHRDLCLEIEQDSLALEHNSLLTPDKIQSRFDLLFELRVLFPQYLFAG